MRVHLIETGEEVNEFLRWLSENRSVACDTETAGLDAPELGRLRTVQFGNGDEAWCIPCEGPGAYTGLVRDVLQVYDGLLLFHNSKFDLRYLEHHVLGDISRLRGTPEDTFNLAALALPGERSLKLKELAVRVLGPSARLGQSALRGVFKGTGWGFGTVPTDHPDFWHYACFDTILTYRVWSDLQSRWTESIRSIYDLERRVIQCAMRMERVGLLVDRQYTESVRDRWDADVENIRRWTRESYGPEFNFGSTTQLAAALLSDGVELTQRTATGMFCMDEKVLKSIDHPLAQATLQAKQLAKWSSVYLGGFLQSLDESGRVHCNIRTIGAKTGRSSISNPPLQQLPRGATVRDCFIAGDGNSLVSADYDGIELRLAAAYSGDPTLIGLFRDGVDPHAYAAERIYGDGWTGEQRQMAKNAGYCIAYGGGPKRLAATAGVDVETASVFREQYLNTFPGLREAIDQLSREGIKKVTSEGWAYVDTFYGRRNAVDARKLYRMFNSWIQGTAADVMKRTIVHLDDMGYGDYMRLPIHDELLFELPSDEADGILQDLIREMTVDDFDVPLTVSGENLHDRWGNKYRDNDTPTGVVPDPDWDDGGADYFPPDLH